MLEWPNFDDLLKCCGSPIRNYIIPGLTSYLISPLEAKNKVRLFHCTRNHQEVVTPHSHRFDFQCLVLNGCVKNTIWVQEDSKDADLFQITDLLYLGTPGDYQKKPSKVLPFTPIEYTFSKGDWYGMTHQEIHSISFEKDTYVLFFEGETISNKSVYIEPFVDGEVINTFKVEPWMFRRSK